MPAGVHAAQRAPGADDNIGAVSSSRVRQCWYTCSFALFFLISFILLVLLVYSLRPVRPKAGQVVCRTWWGGPG